MKVNIFNNPFSLVLLAFLLSPAWIKGQSFNKTIQQSFSGKTSVAFKQSRGPLLVKPATNGQVSFITELRVEAPSQEIADQLFSKFKAEVNESNNKVEIEQQLCCIKNWSQNNGVATITFKDGTKMENIRNYSVVTTLYLPEIDQLSLSNKFESIIVDPQVRIRDLKVKLNSADLEAHDIQGNLSLGVKFGRASMGNVGGQADFELNNGKIKLGDIQGEVIVDSRFSEIEIGTIKRLKAEMNNDRIQIEKVHGSSRMTARFTTCIFGQMTTAQIEANNCSFEIEQASDLKVDSRFSKYAIGQMQNLEVSDSNNDSYNIKEIENFEASLRFPTIKIEKLQQGCKLSVVNGKGKIKVAQADFSGIEVNGKFFDLSLSLPSSSNFHLNSDLKFGNLKTPDNLVTVKKSDKSNQQIRQMKTPNAQDGSPNIQLSGHNMRFKISY